MYIASELVCWPMFIIDRFVLRNTPACTYLWKKNTKL